MKKATLTITVLHLFLPISAFSAESNPYISLQRFKVHESLQINQSNFPGFLMINLFNSNKTEVILLFPIRQV